MTHIEKFRKDYQAPHFLAQNVYLNFEIFDDKTRVTSRVAYKKNNKEAVDIILNGECQNLISVSVNGTILSNTEYTLTDETLTIPLNTDAEIEIISENNPSANTSLEGLYQSNGVYCTQCEAEAFRKITYFIDRPDNMALFTVRIEADKTKCPVLLSNGNLIEEGTIDDGRHFALWNDPFPKPCYLFALVAGDLEQIKDSYTTFKGRVVDLRIYARKHDIDQCAWAMESLKRSFAWDEKTYGLDYQLDRFNIVAVNDFNFGAMENTSLNIFNSAYVLAKPETATDRDFINVEAVIAHEYFHNWSGNRVTCRDWFQLSLKEGLTVFRDQEFTADHHSRNVKRIDDVSQLRARQFVEDAGPLAHPIRPDSYIEMNNFYTATVYEKGAEVIRMMRTIIGTEKYRAGTDLYFARHDGQAVTCDDFVQSMMDASGEDLSQFKLWYAQAGTPNVTIKTTYNESEKTLKIKAKQEIPSTPNQPHKEPMVIPLITNAIGANGETLFDSDFKFILNKAEQEFEIPNIPPQARLSILRRFSAPIILHHENQTMDDLYHLAKYDSDGFNRWDAAQKIYEHLINELIIDKNKPLPHEFIEFITHTISESKSPQADKALLGRILTLPDYAAFTLGKTNINPAAIIDAFSALYKGLYTKLQSEILDQINALSPVTSYTPDSQSMAQRALKRAFVKLASMDTNNHKLFYDLYLSANNMTDRMMMVSAVMDGASDIREKLLIEFYNQYRDYPLVIDKWFAAQASASRPSIADDIKQLAAHPDFTITTPNRVRSLYGVFFNGNPKYFHDESGKGYEILKEFIIKYDRINPQTSARLLTALSAWRTLKPSLQDNIKSALSSIASTPNLSPNVSEIVGKLLNG